MRALLLIDVQNDFLPGGALPVPEGDAIVPLINALLPRFDLVVATQDWHPHEHGSFAANHPGRRPGEIVDLAGLPQILWPIHCVQNTGGACFAPRLETRCIERIFQKGTDAAIDSYSGFFDNGHGKATGLASYLRTRNVSAVCLAGLASDYCVKFTALDAVAEGFRATVIEDACRGVNLQQGDVSRALEEMRAGGVMVMQSKDVN